MKKIIALLLIISSYTGFSQIYETGLMLNAVNVLGDKSTTIGNLVDVGFSPKNIGVIVKKNINPRLAYRAAVNNLSYDGNSLVELSFGVDFNFRKYNLLRYKVGERSTPYFIIEGAALLFSQPGGGRSGTIALPVGIGYKTAITQKIIFSVEGKARVALTDSLDGVVTNASTLDTYYFFGAGIYYAFGWPTSSKTRSKF